MMMIGAAVQFEFEKYNPGKPKKHLRDAFDLKPSYRKRGA